MRVNTGYNREGDYEHLVVKEEAPLLEWLLKNVNESRTKIKATLQVGASGWTARQSRNSTSHSSLV